MPYSAEISRSNPTCFLFLIDQSGSMGDAVADANHICEGSMNTWWRQEKEKTSADRRGSKDVARHLRNVPVRSALRWELRISVAALRFSSSSSKNSLKFKREFTKPYCHCSGCLCRGRPFFGRAVCCFVHN